MRRWVSKWTSESASASSVYPKKLSKHPLLFLKTPQTGFFLKNRHFPVTSGHQLTSRPDPGTSSTLPTYVAKKFGTVAAIVFAPISSKKRGREKKKSSMIMKKQRLSAWDALKINALGQSASYSGQSFCNQLERLQFKKCFRFFSTFFRFRTVVRHIGEQFTLNLVKNRQKLDFFLSWYQSTEIRN